MSKTLLFSVTREDCDWDYFCAGGPGGQHQNKTASACRCTHRASGAVGISRDHRQQGQNKKEAFKRMAATKEFKNWLRIETARRTGQAEQERTKGRSSDHALRIRTYSFPDHRVTDHRIGLDVHDIDKVMGGHIDPFVQGMIELALTKKDEGGE